MAAALHSCLELILWAGCSERVSGLLLVAWDQTVALKNSIFSQVSSGDAHAPSCSPGTAEHGWEQCQCAPRADGQLLQLQGQLFWFSSPSSFREPRSLATMGSSLSRSSFFFLFEQGAEMLGETVGQGSAHSSAPGILHQDHWQIPQPWGQTGQHGVCPTRSGRPAVGCWLTAALPSLGMSRNLLKYSHCSVAAE